MAGLLEINDLKVIFQLDRKIVTAVEKASFTVDPGQTVVLAGESGSGKTVTALSVLRILPASARIAAGRITFQGQDVLALSDAELIKMRGKEIAYIFQEPTSYLNPLFTIGNQIIEALTLHQNLSRAAAHQQALRLLERVKMSDPARVMDTYAHQLSGGMNQRAFIAMSLACRPKLLIADEPTTALDVTIEAQILSLINELQAEFGFALLFITHNLSIARTIADKVCVMYRGRIVEQNQTRSIFEAPQHSHTKELIAAYKKIGTL